VRDVPLREDAHRYHESNGVQFMARLRSLAMNALRLDGFWSITEDPCTANTPWPQQTWFEAPASRHRAP
jgi:hypothetical protein